MLIVCLGHDEFPYQPASINSCKSGQRWPLSLASRKGSPLIGGRGRPWQQEAFMLCPPCHEPGRQWAGLGFLTPVRMVDLFLSCSFSLKINAVCSLSSHLWWLINFPSEFSFKPLLQIDSWLSWRVKKGLFFNCIWSKDNQQLYNLTSLYPLINYEHYSLCSCWQSTS